MHKPGIYFGMPFNEYLSIPYFSRSMAEDYLIDPTGEEAWYNSPDNPNRPEKKESDQMKFGTALHTLILEPDDFEKRYITKPKENDFKDKKILRTIDDLKNFLEEKGEKKTGTKTVLIERATPYLGNEYVIWDDVLFNFYQKVTTNNMIVLDDYDHNRLLEIKSSITRYEEVKTLFSNGYPEVAIIWQDEQTGVMCKCLLDWLQPGAIGELKSFSIKGKKNISKAINDIILYDKYNFQFYIYYNALLNVFKSIKNNKADIYGAEGIEDKWIKDLLNNDDIEFFSLFIRTQAPYQCTIKQYKKASIKDAGFNEYYKTAQNMFNMSIKLHADRIAKFKTSRPRNENIVSSVNDESIPNIIYQDIIE